MIRKAERNGLWNGIGIGFQGPTVSHLLFTDDSLLFAMLGDQNVRQILNILGEYERPSGQKVNILKSKVFCSSSITAQEGVELAEALEVKQDDGKGLYLGLPCTIGRSKKEIFSHVRDKIWNKMKGWKEKSLSQAGKEIMIKAMLEAIPTYIMSCFKLTKAFCKEIQAIVRTFWWEIRRRVKAFAG